MEGTYLVGTIYDVSYDTLVRVFGEPDPMLFDNCKSDAGWETTNLYGREINIYNWKNGPNYCGPDASLGDITQWNIGGRDSEDVMMVERIIEEYRRGHKAGWKSGIRDAEMIVVHEGMHFESAGVPLTRHHISEQLRRVAQ